MKKQILLVVALASFAGCDAATNHAAKVAIDNEPTLVLSPGYKIDVDGKAVPIAGFDECPKNDPMMTKLFGQTPDEGLHTCIVLSKERTHVPVQVALPGEPVTEEWAIIREKGDAENGRPYSRTYLRRPNGSMVTPAERS